MAGLLPETVWSISKDEVLSLLDSGVFVNKPRKVDFYVPSFASYRSGRAGSRPHLFTTISVTGNACALKCKHCGGKVLETMLSADAPSKFFAVAQDLKKKGALGCLVSGGCLSDGSVPLKKFIPTLARIKEELGLVVMVHTGLVNLKTAEGLKGAQIDVAMIDIVGSNRTIEWVYNLNITVEDYEESLIAMSTAGLNFVPHVVVGLQQGKLEGEFQALKMISRAKPSALVIIAFMPVRGTDMANVRPPEPCDIARVIATARSMFPEMQIALGCMRPKGKHRDETDVLALKAGVNAIAFPSEKAVAFAEQNYYESSLSPYCCAQIYLQDRCESRSFSK